MDSLFAGVLYIPCKTDFGKVQRQAVTLFMISITERKNILSNEYKSAIRMEVVTKTFGSVIANQNINLDIRYGEVLSLLGENGSGKTTLMNM